MKDFDNWNALKKKIENYKRAPVRAGEIYWCQMGLNVGVEQDGKGDSFLRPIVVLKKYSHQIVLGAPLTTKIHKGNWYFNIQIEGQKCQVILNQSKPIDTKRLLSSIVEISEKELERMVDAFCELLKEDFNNVQRPSFDDLPLGYPNL